MEIPKAHSPGKILPERQIAKTRILVVDEQPLLRHGIVTYLNCQPDMIVCGEADCIASARRKLVDCRPHLLVIGLRLGASDSLEFFKALKAQTPELLILVYSAFEETIFAERALRAGAHGYVMKMAPKEELLTAIRDVLRGQIYVSRDLALRAFQKSLATPQRTRASGDLPVVGNLSDREMHVFQLIGLGLGTRKIAHSLKLSVKTIETHRENIKRKLGLNSGRQLVERAIKFVEENFLPPSAAAGKKKLVRFPAA
ncbi:MAG TPA: response regulator transcription factor [Candidatus Udaeobacter sp.]|jgi:DNA-binding NarL/FixJ family response regulator|nr:response regulator transcription factor [Candidatus Udaeobacter sp.]